MIHSLKHEYDIGQLCDTLGVSRAGYYDWCRRPPSSTAVRRERLIEQIRVLHAESDRTYGSPRIHMDLLERDVKLNVKTVSKYMRIAGIRSKIVKPFKVSTTDSDHDLPVFENSLDRQFAATGPTQKWLCTGQAVPPRHPLYSHR